MAYADDIVFVFHSEGEAIQVISKFHEALAKFGMKIGWNKSGVMSESVRLS